MSLLKAIQRSKVYQTLLAIAGILFFYAILYKPSPSTSSTRSNGNVLSNEEVNALLSGDANSGSDIVKESVDSLALGKPYLETGLKSNNWGVAGDTLIKNWEYVRLTSAKKDQAGILFNRNSFDDNGFEVEFNFSIHGDAKPSQLKADGFALFLTDKPLVLGTVFGAQDKFNGLGLFFDTYRNARKGPVFPYITVMNGDGETAYDKQNDGKANELGGCTARNIYKNKQGFVRARLIHTVEDGYLSLDYDHNGDWTNCFSIKDVHIPKQRYLGFGAATGELVENVDLFDVKVHRLKQFGETINSWNDFIEHIDEPEKAEDDKDDPDYEIDYKGRERRRRKLRKARNAKQRAKLQAKLRNKEKRALRFDKKKREDAVESESLGFFGTLLWLIKMFFIFIFVTFVGYVAFTIYRVKKRTWRSQRKTTGLLD